MVTEKNWKGKNLNPLLRGIGKKEDPALFEKKSN